MSEVKIFRIQGTILKPNYISDFTKEIRATTPEAATEEIYSNFGSQHKVRRSRIRIALIQELKPEESSDPLIRQLSGV